MALSKALLHSIWYDLSDVKLAETLDDRSSFRRFCGFPSPEPTPERTAFVRFRKALVERELDKVLSDAVAAQLKAKAIRVKTGTLVDATIIASASEGDDDAHWVKHKGKPAVHGFKAHVGFDAETALAEKISITPANVNDGRAGPDTLPDDPGEVLLIVLIEDRASARQFAPRAVRRASWQRVCGPGPNSKRPPGSIPGTSRPIAFAAGSRRSSAHRHEAIVCARCDGEVSSKPPYKFSSP